MGGARERPLVLVLIILILFLISEEKTLKFLYVISLGSTNE